MKPLEAIRCTSAACTCECFSPGKVCLRYCDSCTHGWVAHALDKLGYQHAYSLGMQVEVVQPNIVFDIASLMLYGAQATPVRLKILLDRLFSVLQHEEVLQVLHGFGWTYEDYARGYILQDNSGRVLDKWSMATRDEEHVILQQFLRFGETKAIAQEIILQDTRDKQEAYSKQTSRAESEIKKFIERSNLSVQSFMKLGDPARHMFAAAGRLPFVGGPAGTRILPSPILTPTPYSPSRDQTARPLSLTTSPAAATSTPLSTPPISRLQAYEFRRELAVGGASPAPTPTPTHTPSMVDKVNLPAPVVNTGMTVPTVVASMAVMGAGHRSPVMDSPQNLSTTPSSVHSSAPSPCVTPHKAQPMDSGGEMSAGFADDSDDDESMGAIDYSTKDTATNSPTTSSSTTNTATTNTTTTPGNGDPAKLAAAVAAARHLRKSNNPIKRQWIPSAGFGNTFIGPNGKKRVLCTACNKTFCDKGALKIHYSAVHLKEMHKCSVDGCNMMFSSRRSRNRHSANPNPKLHMPQKRKELEGLDDDSITPSVSKVMSSLTTSLSSPMSSSMSGASPNMAVGAPGALVAQRSLEVGGLLRADPAYFLELGAQFPFASPPPEKRIKLEGGQGQDRPTDLSSVSSCDKDKTSDEEKRDPELATTSSYPHIEPDNDDDDDEINPADSEPVDVEETEATADGEDNGKSEANGQRWGNRRKSNAPTRCAKNEDAMEVTDDNSDDKELQQQAHLPYHLPSVRLSAAGSAEDRPPQTVVTVGVAVQAGTAEALDTFGRQALEPQQGAGDVAEDAVAVASAVEGSSLQEGEKHSGASSFPQIASLLLSAKEQQDRDDDSSDNELIINGDVEEDMEDRADDKDDGNNADAAVNDNDHNHNNVAREEEEEGEESYGSIPSPSSDTAEGMAVLDPGSEVYLAQDNTRKCALCGKMFQNQFSVKIHFQNVHLKLMHGCTVDGCSAAFPSKRSRDRHSSNLNLHRKMLSGGESGLDNADPTLRQDILSTLYGANQLAAGAALNLQCNGQSDREEDAPRHTTHDLPLPLLARDSSSPAFTQIHNGEEENDVAADREEEKLVETADPLSSMDGPTAEDGSAHLGPTAEDGSAHSGPTAEDGSAHPGPTAEDGSAHPDSDSESRERQAEDLAAAAVPADCLAPVRREEPLCMSRKPVCCGMTFHTESALKEHYSLSHPSQTLPPQALPVPPLKPRHTAATETLLSSRRPRHRPKHKNGLQRLVSTGRKNGFS